MIRRKNIIEKNNYLDVREMEVSELEVGKLEYIKFPFSNFQPLTSNL